MRASETSRFLTQHTPIWGVLRQRALRVGCFASENLRFSDAKHPYLLFFTFSCFFCFSNLLRHFLSSSIRKVSDAEHPQYALTHDKRKGVYKVGGACVRNLKVFDAEHPQYELTHNKRKGVY